MGTEASWKRQCLHEQSSAHGPTSRIRTEALRPRKRRCSQTLKIALIRCVIFVRAKLLAPLERSLGGSELMRSRSGPIIKVIEP